MRTLALIGLAVLVLPALSAASAPPPGLADQVARDAAARGIALPASLEVRIVDLATGASWAEVRPLDAFLAEVDVAAQPALPAPRAANRVLGDVQHSCYDPNRLCYKFYTNAAGSGTPLWVRDAQDTHDAARSAYDGTPARNALAFPSPGASAIYVQGVYQSGSHKAASPVLFASQGSPNAGVAFEDGMPGGAQTKADRAVWGGGVGKAMFGFVEWGPNLFLSFGSLRGHGAWTFCATETDPDCASP